MYILPNIFANNSNIDSLIIIKVINYFHRFSGGLIEQNFNFLYLLMNKIIYNILAADLFSLLFLRLTKIFQNFHKFFFLIKVLFGKMIRYDPLIKPNYT